MNTTQSQPLFRETFVLILVSVVLALVYNAFSPKSISYIRKPVVKVAVSDSALFLTQQSSSTPSSDSSQKKHIPVIAPLHERAVRNADSMAALVKREKPARRSALAGGQSRYRTISLDQLKRLLEEHRGVLIDARGTDEFERGHIKGARNFPFLEVEKHFEEMMTIPRDTLILIYCSNPECPLGRSLVDFMSQMEFHNIFLYDEGWDGWEKAKLPAEK